MTVSTRCVQMRNRNRTVDKVENSTKTIGKLIDMSAQGKVHHHGASHHADLFESASRSNADDTSDQLLDDYSPQVQEQKIHEIYGDVSSDPLQLEHIIGYDGAYRQTVLSLNEDYIVKSMGNLVAIENLMDPHDQKLLRGHDMEVLDYHRLVCINVDQISALAISPSGSLIASGQKGTKNYKGNAAPIFIWQASNCRRLIVLRGLTQRVNIIEFSPDEKFICGCGEDSLLYVWELSSGEVVYGARQQGPVSFLSWIDHYAESRRVVYELALGIGSTTYQGNFHFDQGRVQWVLKMKPYSVPAGGVVRYFQCKTVSNDKKFLYVGSTGADIIVYRRDMAVFRSLIPACPGGVQSLLMLPNDDLLCGGGDGVLRKLAGEDMSWTMVQEAPLDGSIVSLSLSQNNSEVIIGTSGGNIYRCLIANLTSSLICEGCTASITCTAVGTQPNILATGAANGEIKVWDTTDYTCLAVLRMPKSGSVLCLCILDDNSVISGWEDGFIRCHDLASLNKQLWYLPQAHRGGTNTISACTSQSLQYFVSGGNDGAVRVWRLSNRELVTQYTEHTKGVSKVLIDIDSPNIVHSASFDSSVLTYDLSTERRKICHIFKGGSITHMTQRHDSEKELITCDTSGKLLHWDCDIREPVLTVQDAGNASLRVCTVSPTGRFLAFAGDDSILKILDVATSRIISLGQGQSSGIRTISWMPDEKQIVTGGDDRCLCLWNFFV